MGGKRSGERQQRWNQAWRNHNAGGFVSLGWLPGSWFDFGVSCQGPQLVLPTWRALQRRSKEPHPALIPFLGVGRGECLLQLSPPAHIAPSPQTHASTHHVASSGGTQREVSRVPRGVLMCSAPASYTWPWGGGLRCCGVGLLRCSWVRCSSGSAVQQQLCIVTSLGHITNMKAATTP